MPHLGRQKDTALELLLFAPLTGLIYFVVFSFTGGFAVAIHARGREDRSLIVNAGVGLVGWVAAAVIWRFVTGDWPTEFTLGLGLLALLAAIIFVRLLQRRGSRTLERGSQA